MGSRTGSNLPLRSGSKRNLVRRFLRTHQPDVLCLQETKVPDQLFPGGAFNDLGYVHQAINGQKGYHGVAVISRLPFDGNSAKGYCGKADSRHVGVSSKEL